MRNNDCHKGKSVTDVCTHITWTRSRICDGSVIKQLWKTRCWQMKRKRQEHAWIYLWSEPSFDIKGVLKKKKKNGAHTLTLSTAHTCYNLSPLTRSLHTEGNEIVLSKPVNWIRLTQLALCPLPSNLSRQGARVHWNQWWVWCGLGAGRQISQVSQMIFHSIFSPKLHLHSRRGIRGSRWARTRLLHNG